jgi:GrpB-like predicted nucleotidyltransferase (UPF0157 family)
MSKDEYKNRKYHVEPYSSAWPHQFESEAKILKDILGKDATAIEHIGSTSVPGMDGKPTIDILVLIKDLSATDQYLEKMKNTGYEHLSGYVMPDSILFRRMKENILLSNVHVFQKDHPHVHEMLSLRDYLRSHPEEVKAYSDKKKELFQKYPEDYATYRKLKDVYMDDLKKRVLDHGPKFISSEAVEVDGQKMLFLASPHAIVENIFKALTVIGPEKFFSNPDEKTKKLRESMAECFFAFALKKESGKDWWIMQPEKDPPDFNLTSWTENPITITLAPFELVEIPGRCKSFEEMMQIVRKKLEKGYPQNYHLLIFVNNGNSTDWIELLHRKLPESVPFQTIWTLHLLVDRTTKDLSAAVANKLRPLPLSHSEISFNDPSALRFRPLPSFMELVKNGSRTFIKFNKEFADALNKEMMKALRDRRQRPQP